MTAVWDFQLEHLPPPGEDFEVEDDPRRYYTAPCPGCGKPMIYHRADSRFDPMLTFLARGKEVFEDEDCFDLIADNMNDCLENDHPYIIPEFRKVLGSEPDYDDYDDICAPIAVIGMGPTRDYSQGKRRKTYLQ